MANYFKKQGPRMSELPGKKSLNTIYSALNREVKKHIHTKYILVKPKNIETKL